MTVQLHDTGEEYLMDKLSGESFAVGLYNDGADNLGDASDVGAITTEPTGTSYSRITDTFTSGDMSGDWGIDNDSQLSYNTSDSDQSVDAYFIVVNYASEDAGDGGTATDHLLVTGSLSQPRNLSEIDTLNIAANSVGLKVS